MDSHKLNMYAAAAIGSLLFFMLLGFFSDLIYLGGGDEENEQLAFAVEVEEAESGEETAETIDWAALVAAANPTNGEKIFGKCKACHKVTEGANGVGPTLWGVVGSDIASTAGYGYSDALTGMEGNWDLEQLSNFLEAPKAYAPGTKMSFAGLKKITDRVDLIAYLNQVGGSPIDMVPPGDKTEAGSDTSTAEAAETAVTETAAAVEAATETATETAAAVTESVTETITETVVAATGGEEFSSLLASADSQAGKKIFRKCRACHAMVEGQNGVGPSLWGVVNREVASAEGYNFSDAMKAKTGTWTGADLFAFIENPKGVVPGTKMRFPGVKKAQDRINLITFLNEADGTPEPLQ